MATLEDLQQLLSQGGKGFMNPWSQMMAGDQQNQPDQSMAVPPMSQPDYSSQIPADSSGDASLPMIPPASNSPQPNLGSGNGSLEVSGTTMNPEMLKMYKQILAKSNQSIQDQKDYLGRLKDYRSKVEQNPLEPDYTGLMMASDAWNGTRFQPQYKAPIDQEAKDRLIQQADLQVQNQLGNISKEELNSLKTQLGGVMESEKFREAGANKSSDQDEKDRQNLMKALDTEKSSGRFTPIGKAQGNVYQAQRVKALIDQYAKDPNSMPLTGPASLSEIAIGLNSLLSATGGSEESRKSLIPSSARGRFSTLEQFLANKPVGAEMEAFVKNASDTLNRETQTNQNQIDKYRDKIKNAWGLGRYAGRHPEEFNKMVNFYVGNPEDNAQASPASGGSFADPDKEKRYQEWKAQQK